MRSHTGRIALVTGCSSGIGQATAEHLRRAGLLVYATGRRLDTLAGLADKGIRVLELDVTDESSMIAALEMIKAGRGQVDVLVNNAGFELAGAVETIPEERARQLFDTNFFGLARLTQLVLPGMRERRYGRIINVSSIYGRLAVPGEAYYAASKHAVAAFSEALRREVGGFGIRVALIEPTAARTRLDANTVLAGSDGEGPYAAFYHDLARWRARTYGGPPRNVAGRLAVSADDVAKAITRAATSPRPRARYPVGALAHGLFMLRRWLPAPAFDAFVRRQFPAPPV